jgi:hypothetical protein
MPKKTEMKTKAEQIETMSKEINPSGAGEDPAIKALVSNDFVNMKDTDALAVATAVAKIVRGQLQEEIDGTMGALKATIAKMEETAQKYENDRLKFAEDLFNDAEKMRKTSNENIERDSVNLMEQVQQEARVAAMLKREKIDELVKTSPTVKMMHPGIPIRVRKGGVKTTIMKPFEIRYEHLVFVLPPNKPVDIPDFIYKAFMEKQEAMDQKNKLREVLRGGKRGYNEAITAEPAVDPNYAQKISAQMASQQIPIPTGGGND